MEYFVRHGGLMRCCLESLEIYMDAQSAEPLEGQEMDCQYESAGNANLIYRKRAWEWNRP